MKFRSGYKYQSVQDESIKVEIHGFDIDTQFIRLTPDGMLTGKAGYAWDGASGPTWDEPIEVVTRGPFFHDILYQLMREGRLPTSYREYADGLMYTLIIEDGRKYVSKKNPLVRKITMHLIEMRAYAWYLAVREFADDAALPENDRKVYDTEAA
jgi:hypothetical protein